MNNDFELENMRQQMNTLKKKLEDKKIVNDRILRRSTRKDVNSITRRYYVIMAICLIMIPYGYWAFVVMTGLSIPFWIVTSIMMLLFGGVAFYNIRKINDPDLMSAPLLEARKKVASAKKFHNNWLMIGIPIVILWLGWFCFETYKKNPDSEVILYCAVVGAIVGAIIGFSLHFRTQRQYQAIIDEIEDFMEE